MKIVKALGTMLLGLVTLALMPLIIIGLALYEMGNEVRGGDEDECRYCKDGRH